eukprot:TRINITY_DN20814_c0_g1_i1.p1 TRINITY_DN20814_c0_g1~~TRINITY_DN20814_c0_g1_i1.p1  ORF type:complete len:245 (+),score=73.59 TRINITY_DN20814_c0_g1_i1:59-793(+)
MQLRRTIAKLLVRDLGRMCRGVGEERELEVQQPCVRELCGHGWVSSVRDHVAEMPAMLEKVVMRGKGPTVVVDWELFRSDVVKKLWFGCDEEELGKIENNAFDLLQWAAEQRVLRGVAREHDENGVKVTSMIGREVLADSDRYLFYYRLRVENHTENHVRLIARNLNFYDSKKNLSESVLNGLGVMGHTPLLNPGHSFTWHSQCELPTATGTMTGSLEFTIENEKTWNKHARPVSSTQKTKTKP